MKKVISNFQRRYVHSSEFDSTCKIKQRQRLVSRPQVDDVTKRVVNVVKYESYSPADDINKYSVNDFALESLLSVGAPLSPKQLSSSKFSALESFENGVENINE